MHDFQGSQSVLANIVRHVSGDLFGIFLPILMNQLMPKKAIERADVFETLIVKRADRTLPHYELQK